jgi:hypothetical protein
MLPPLTLGRKLGMLLTQEFLDSKSFLEFLKYIKENLPTIFHQSKSDSAYSKTMDLMRIIRNRIVSNYNFTWEEYESKHPGHDFWLDEQKLESYDRKDSDKRKNEIIEEFKSYLTDDLDKLIYNLEKPAQPPAENEEI